MESNITGCEQIIVDAVWLIHEVWSASVFGMEKIYHAGLELTERHLPPCPLVAGIKEMNHHTWQRVILFCLFVFACVSVHMCMQMSVEARRVRQLPRNCNFRAIVSCPAWAVGSELWFFARAASVLTCWATSLAPAFLSKNMVEIVSTLIVLVCFMWLESKPRASWLLMNTIWLPYSSRLKEWFFILFGLLSSPEQPRLTSVSLPFCLSLQKDGVPGLHQNAHSQMCLSKLSAFLFPWAPSFCHRCLVWQLGGHLQTKI